MKHVDEKLGHRPALILGIFLVLITAYRMWLLPRLGITLYVDEAQYWTWAQALDWGYYSKPPVIAWLIAASTAIFGDGMLAIKLPALLLYPVTACLLFVLARRLFDERTGLRVAIAFALMPLVSALGLFVSTDAPLLACWTAGMILLLRAVEDNRWGDWVLLGVVAGLGLMSKYTMGAFAASALIYLAIDSQRRRQLINPRLWVALFVALLILAPNLFWNWQNDFPTLRHTAEITHVDGNNDKTGNPLEFIGAQVLSLGPLFGLAFFAALIAGLRRFRDPKFQFLLSFSLPLLAITGFQSLRAEANGNWAAPALLAALILTVHWLAPRRRLWWWAIGVNIVLMFGVYHLNDARIALGEELPARWDPLNRGRGWDGLARAARPLVEANPQAVLLVDDRAFAAHLLYELRDLKPEIASWNWNAQKRILDHYQLTSPVSAVAPGRDAVAVIKWPAGPVEARFNDATPLQPVVIPVAKSRNLDASIGVLRNFKGSNGAEN